MGIITIGRSSARALGSPKYCNIAEGAPIREPEEWVPIDTADVSYKSVYSFSEEHGELYVPNCREAVEDVAAWTIFTPAEEEGYRSAAFLGHRTFRERLRSQTWNVRNGDLSKFVSEHCIDKALFQMLWGPGSWILFPGTIELNHLVRLADPVAAKINTELTD
ncbi:MAG: hypothetical protein JO104_01755 [Candidatus Eremiobacteraeota bacterium]|nr:hypothetical protein [Candidatus Eremiobacteraeota bacterium]